MRKLFLYAFCAVLLAACSKETRELAETSVLDTKVVIYSPHNMQSADGFIDISSADGVEKKIQFADADDYPEDVAAKVAYFGAHGKRVIICLRDAGPNDYGVAYRSPDGVTVEVRDFSVTKDLCKATAH